MLTSKTPPNEEDLFKLLNEGSRLITEYNKNKEKIYLTRAYDIWSRLDRVAPPNWHFRYMLDYNLGLALHFLAEVSRDELICQQAITKLRLAIQSDKFDGQTQAMALMELAAAYGCRFNLQKNEADLSASETATRQAMNIPDLTTYTHAEFQAQLGGILLSRYKYFGDNTDLVDGLETLLDARTLNRQFFLSAEGAVAWLCYGMSCILESEGLGDRLPALISVAEEELSDNSIKDESRASWMEVLAQCLFVRFRKSGDLTDKEQALKLTGMRIEMLGNAARERSLGRLLPTIKNMPDELRNEFYELFLQPPSRHDVDAAIKANPTLEQAVNADAQLPEAFTQNWVEAEKARESWEETLKWEDLSKAVDLYHKLVTAYGFRASPPAFRCVVLQAAGKAAFDLYWCTGDLERLDLALTLANEAYADSMEFKRTILDTGRESQVDHGLVVMMVFGLPITAHSLGNALSEKFLRTGNASLLNEAVYYCQEALNLLRIPGDEVQMFHSSLGTALRYKFSLSNNPKDIDNAIWHQRKAVELERERTESSGGGKWVIGSDGRVVQKPLPTDRLARFLVNLGTACRYRYIQSKSLVDIDEAIACHREALALFPKGGPGYPHCLSHLFDDLKLASASGSRNVTDELTELSLLAEQLDSGAANHLLTLHCNIGRSAFLNRNWQQAVNSFAQACLARDRLQSLQPNFEAKEDWLSATQGITNQYAYALAQLGRLDDAITVTEQGLARLICETLKWRDVQLDRLRISTPGLVQPLLDARQRLQFLERPQVDSANMKGMDSIQADFARREAWSNLQRAEEQIRESIGTETWMLEASLDQIRDVLLRQERERALVYLNITKHGSIALIITADEIRRVELTMSELELDQLLHFFDERGLGLIDYQTEGYSGFDSTLGRALRKLGDDLMTPVATCLTDMGVNRVALICAGRLNLLPLHASQWLCDGKTTTFMDNFVVSYLPNATVAFAKSAKALESSLLSRVVAFGNPTPCRFPQIPGAEAEVHAIGRLLQGHHPKIFCGENATRNTFLQFHQDATIFHFAGHGVFDEENALKSHLIFSNDEHLTVKDCLSHEIRPPAGSLAILSGCQTALVNFKSLPDEAIGLPASLLVAGFNQVIGSLWRVADQATALLMVRFYELLKLSGGQCCPSEALQRATIWFRDSTGAELNQFSCKHNLHFDPLSDDLYIRDYPSLWSAFIYVGL